MADPETTRRAVEGFFAALGQPDRDAWVALFDPEIEFEDPLGTPRLSGPDGVARFHKGLGRAWAALAMTPRQIHVRGSQAAAARASPVGRSASTASTPSRWPTTVASRASRATGTSRA